MQTSVLAPPAPRLNGIDGLRGILACSVMLYHYTVWAGIDVGPRFSGLLSAVAFYAVEAFFVISGISLAFVYERTDFSRPRTVGTFFVRRFFRIAPLFYAVLAATFMSFIRRASRCRRWRRLWETCRCCSASLIRRRVW